MTDYVLIVSLGPVQGFIAAARRSRDLWSGSWLLSEISKAAARALAQRGARLVFPAPGSDLAPESGFSVGNKVQAVVSAAHEDAVRTLAAEVATAARERFRQLAAQARSRLGRDADAALRDAVWRTQVDDYVEHFAAWARVDAQGYASAVDRAASALAARKATRDFTAAARDANEAPFFGLPKSSLDGARETVLHEDEHGFVTRRKLGLSGSEQLDCAGVVKRLAGNVEQFTPLTRIAAHGWIESLPAEARARLCEAYEPLVKAELATRATGNPRFRELPFDGQFLYRSRLDAAMGEVKGDAQAAADLQALRDVLKPLWKKYGEPCPYFVILLADGDRMGALLNEVGSEAHHVRITQALSDFAGAVAERVRAFEGHAVYAGGDDVFAFVPLHRAFECADALQADFAAALQPLARELGARSLPTLSVGLGIGHMLEPLGELRALASRAEKFAKGDEQPEALRRNALAIVLRTRGNSETRLRLRWEDGAALAHFREWLGAYAPEVRSLPSRIAYDTRAVHARTAFATEGDTPQRGIAQAEFNRMLGRARTESGRELDAPVVERLKAREQAIGLAALADELIVARWMAARTAQDLGERE
jgi:CRISPR-associated protein Cmr2